MPSLRCHALQIEPENSKISDLDPETAKTVTKMVRFKAQKATEAGKASFSIYEMLPALSPPNSYLCLLPAPPLIFLPQCHRA